MARVKTSWQKKQDIEGFSFRSITLPSGKSEGLSPLASWLDNTSPQDVLPELRNYQDEWCNHLFKGVAVIRREDIVSTFVTCIECGKAEIQKRAATSG
jgi:hypothetical protein